MKYKNNNEGEIIERLDYSKRIVFKVDDFKQPGHLLQVVTIPPKTKQRIHHHTGQTEVFYFLSGEAELIVNETSFSVTTGDAVICEPGDKHNLWNQSDKPLEVLVFKIDYQGDEDTHWENV